MQLAGLRYNMYYTIKQRRVKAAAKFAINLLTKKQKIAILIERAKNSVFFVRSKTFDTKATKVTLF